ncbi:MAG: peptide chain release factor 3 [Gemmatimonadales bacterium]
MPHTEPTDRPSPAAQTARRTIAIISHPDAGKTTLTEKLLLYGGAIHLAGSVKARRAQRTTRSDWLAIERERGISVTAAVLQFDLDGYRINLIDTPGHADFSEDTYRALQVADTAIMLLDNRRVVEQRTRRLFDVARATGIPVATFVNKCDRQGLPPLEILDQVEAELGMPCSPMTWPVQQDGRLVGIVDLADHQLMLFDHDGSHGSKRLTGQRVDVRTDAAADLLGASVYDALSDELALVAAATPPHHRDAFRRGAVSPTFFGSALTNMGVEHFFSRFLTIAAPPRAFDPALDATTLDSAPFSAMVFKIQANMDPRHRDRIAMLRVTSGRFAAGMTAVIARTGAPIRLLAPKAFLAAERHAIEEAWPGDIVGIHDRGDLQLGDTVSLDGSLAFPTLPRFAPEHFAEVVPADPMRRKATDMGLRHLADEGLMLLLLPAPDAPSGPRPVAGVVGTLQFDTLAHRLQGEYQAPIRLERLPFTVARWVEGPEQQIREVGRAMGRDLRFDERGRPVVLFVTEWSLRSAEAAHPALTFRASDG